MVDGPKDCLVERSERENQVSYINTYMWNLEKNGTDEPICKAEIETQTQKTIACHLLNFPSPASHTLKFSAAVGA